MKGTEKQIKYATDLLNGLKKRWICEMQEVYTIILENGISFLDVERYVDGLIDGLIEANASKIIDSIKKGNESTIMDIVNFLAEDESFVPASKQEVFQWGCANLEKKYGSDAQEMKQELAEEIFGVETQVEVVETQPQVVEVVETQQEVVETLDQEIEQEFEKMELEQHTQELETQEVVETQLDLTFDTVQSFLENTTKIEQSENGMVITTKDRKFYIIDSEFCSRFLPNNFYTGSEIICNGQKLCIADRVYGCWEIV
jgi:hypothetical protein